MSSAEPARYRTPGCWDCACAISRMRTDGSTPVTGPNARASAGVNLPAQSQTTFTDAGVAGNYMLGQLPPMSATQNGNVGEFDLSSAGGITGGITTASEGYFTWDQAQTMTDRKSTRL